MAGRKRAVREERKNLEHIHCPCSIHFCWFQFHQRYNPNLIDDDDQELSAHLKIRHERSRKISEVVLQNTDFYRASSPASTVRWGKLF